MNARTHSIDYTNTNVIYKLNLQCATLLTRYTKRFNSNDLLKQMQICSKQLCLEQKKIVQPETFTSVFPLTVTKTKQNTTLLFTCKQADQ